MMGISEPMHNNLYEQIQMSPLTKDRYVLLSDFKYKDIIIPKGYRTNGADIPRIFWSIWPPNRSNYMPAVIIHDYLCDKEEYNKADKYFLEVLIKLKIPKITTLVFYYSVKCYHMIRYGTK